MQFYDTPRNVREAIECPPPNPLGNYDYPNAGKNEDKNHEMPFFSNPLGNYDYPTAGKNGNSEEKNHKMPFFPNPLGNYAYFPNLL